MEPSKSYVSYINKFAKRDDPRALLVTTPPLIEEGENEVSTKGQKDVLTEVKSKYRDRTNYVESKPMSNKTIQTLETRMSSVEELYFMSGGIRPSGRLSSEKPSDTVKPPPKRATKNLKMGEKGDTRLSSATPSLNLQLEKKSTIVNKKKKKAPKEKRKTSETTNKQ